MFCKRFASLCYLNFHLRPAGMALQSKLYGSYVEEKSCLYLSNSHCGNHCYVYQPRHLSLRNLHSNNRLLTNDLDNYNKNKQLDKGVSEYNETTKSQLLRLIGLAKPEIYSITGAITLLMVSSSVTLAVPFFMGKLIDLVQSASESGGVQVTLQPMLLGLSTIFVIGALANSGRVYLLQMSGQRITKNLRERVFSSIMSQEVAFYDKSRSGELINRLSSDVELVSSAVTQNVSDGLRACAQVTAGIGMMFFMSTQLATVVLAVVPPVAITAVIYGRYVRNVTKRTQDALAESTQMANEKISNIRTVRAFAKETAECKTYMQKMLKVLNIAKREAMARSIFFGLTGLSGNAIMLLVLYNGGIMMQSAELSVGDLSAFLLYSGYVAISIGGLSNFYTSINKSIGASSRLWQLIDRIPKIPLTGQIPDQDVIKSNIEFMNIGFSYPGRTSQPVFTNLNLTIESGKVTAVVGPSGCGKTTLGSLLLRFYEPDSGVIKLGVNDLMDISPSWIRNNIGTVSQDPVLFAATIGENIAYGGKYGVNVSKEELKYVAEQANALKFISELPYDFDTYVGERGVTLSGGQRQRVAIARALIKDPQILLLDEATSALDAVSEHLVRDALDKVSVGRTTITIAHRLSTVRGAHHIIVLGTDGCVKEQGTYNDLMLIEDGLFKQLVEKQTLLST